MARHNRVLYVSLPLDINTVLRGYREPATRNRLRHVLAPRPPRPVADNLWVSAPDMVGLSINWLSSRRLFAALNRFNSKLLARKQRYAEASELIENMLQQVPQYSPIL